MKQKKSVVQKQTMCVSLSHKVPAFYTAGLTVFSQPIQLLFNFKKSNKAHEGHVRENVVNISFSNKWNPNS